MALLTDQDRKDLWGKFMSIVSGIPEEIKHGMTKHELREAVNTTDQWIEDNQAAFNQALPEPARSVLTGKQKVRLFMMIATQKYEVT